MPRTIGRSRRAPPRATTEARRAGFCLGVRRHVSGARALQLARGACGQSAQSVANVAAGLDTQSADDALVTVRLC